jgi:hypothetical protein
MWRGVRGQRENISSEMWREYWRKGAGVAKLIGISIGQSANVGNCIEKWRASKAALASRRQWRRGEGGGNNVQQLYGNIISENGGKRRNCKLKAHKQTKTMWHERIVSIENGVAAARARQSWRKRKRNIGEKLAAKRRSGIAAAAAAQAAWRLAHGVSGRSWLVACGWHLGVAQLSGVAMASCVRRG